MCAFALSISFALNTEAAVKVTSVVGASNTANIGSTAEDAATPVIFGGVTGTGVSDSPSGASCANGVLCNTCILAPINGVGGDATAPCNEQAITTSTVITIQFTAAKAGYPMLTDENKTTVIEKGTSSVAIGQTAEIVTTWGEICLRIDGMDSTCNPNGSGGVDTETLYIGVSKDADDTLDDANDDEFGQITVTVSDAMGQSTHRLAPACNSGSNLNSICSYSIQSGDEKAVLTNLGKINSFPTLSGINIAAMRVYFEQCNWNGGTLNAGQFDTIHPQSNPVTLAIEVDADGIPELVENDITGLTNGLTYCTKVGQVDQAGNVGLYTAAADDGFASPAVSCPVNYLKDPGTGADFPGSCHVARPDEVLGVMSESCFIATAAYGSPWAIKVQTFRDFRNKFLLSNKVGREIVKWYYKTSPKFAKKIARSNTARAITRGALSPIWIFARISLKIGLLATTLLTFSIFIAPFAWLAYRRQRKAA